MKFPSEFYRDELSHWTHNIYKNINIQKPVEFLNIFYFLLFSIIIFLYLFGSFQPFLSPKYWNYVSFSHSYAYSWKIISKTNNGWFRMIIEDSLFFPMFFFQAVQKHGKMRLCLCNFCLSVLMESMDCRSCGTKFFERGNRSKLILIRTGSYEFLFATYKSLNKLRINSKPPPHVIPKERRRHSTVTRVLALLPIAATCWQGCRRLPHLGVVWKAIWWWIDFLACIHASTILPSKKSWRDWFSH